MTWKVTPSTVDAAGHLVAPPTGTPTTSLLGGNITSATPSGVDSIGTVAVVIGIGGLAANSRICRLTFAAPFAGTPRVRLANETSGVGLAVVNPYVLAQTDGTSFDLACNQPLVLGTYTFGWTAL